MAAAIDFEAEATQAPAINFHPERGIDFEPEGEDSIGPEPAAAVMSGDTEMQLRDFGEKAQLPHVPDFSQLAYNPQLESNDPDEIFPLPQAIKTNEDVRDAADAIEGKYQYVLERYGDNPDVAAKAAATRQSELGWLKSKADAAGLPFGVIKPGGEVVEEKIGKEVQAARMSPEDVQALLPGKLPGGIVPKPGLLAKAVSPVESGLADVAGGAANPENVLYVATPEMIPGFIGQGIAQGAVNTTGGVKKILTGQPGGGEELVQGLVGGFGMAALPAVASHPFLRGEPGAATTEAPTMTAERAEANRAATLGSLPSGFSQRRAIVIPREATVIGGENEIAGQQSQQPSLANIDDLQAAIADLKASLTANQIVPKVAEPAMAEASDETTPVNIEASKDLANQIQAVLRGNQIEEAAATPIDTANVEAQSATRQLDPVQAAIAQMKLSAVQRAASEPAPTEPHPQYFRAPPAETEVTPPAATSESEPQTRSAKVVSTVDASATVSPAGTAPGKQPGLAQEKPGLIAGSAAERWADYKISQSRGRVNSGVDPELMAAYGLKGAGIIERGVRDFAAWSAEMIKQFGPKSEAWLQQVYEHALKILQPTNGHTPDTMRSQLAPDVSRDNAEKFWEQVEKPDGPLAQNDLRWLDAWYDRWEQISGYQNKLATQARRNLLVGFKQNLIRATLDRANREGWTWGYKEEHPGNKYGWVLYADTPYGQASFHVGKPLGEVRPYAGQWDRNPGGSRLAIRRVFGAPGIRSLYKRFAGGGDISAAAPTQSRLTGEPWDVEASGKPPLPVDTNKTEPGENVKSEGTGDESTTAVTPVASKPSQAAEQLAQKLESLKSGFKGGASGNLQAFGVVPYLWDGAVSVAQNIIRSGGSVADAIEAAIRHIKENFKGSFDEGGARAALARSLVLPDNARQESEAVAKAAPAPGQAQQAQAGSLREWGKYDLRKVPVGSDPIALWRSFPKSETPVSPQALPRTPEGLRLWAKNQLAKLPSAIRSPWRNNVVLHKGNDVADRASQYISGGVGFGLSRDRAHTLPLLANTIRNAMAYAPVRNSRWSTYLYRYAGGQLHVVLINDDHGTVEKQFVATPDPHDPNAVSDLRVLYRNGIERDPSKARPLRNVLRFRRMEVRAVRSLSHMKPGTLRAMVQIGFAGSTKNGSKIVLHHLGQNPDGPLVEMPEENNNVHNRNQHPFGNKRGAGLSETQRDSHDIWRNEYWRWRARQELARRRNLER